MPARTSTSHPAQTKPARRQRQSANGNEGKAPHGVSASSATRPASMQPQPQGICSTCVHAVRCLFVRAARQPILHCEEFDDGRQRSRTA